MAYEYSPREAAEALPKNISEFQEFVEDTSKNVINLMTENAEQIGMKPVSEAVEAATLAIGDAVKLFNSMLGDQNDKPTTGSLYGLKKLADEQAELQN